ncbi:RuvC-like resolvase [Gordonia phage Clown]|uniref:RuvC-like resolvase n=1 Tax=Gordonia phage Clown TaxID=2759393 RepID=A0A7L7SQ31_9CAUD|nr:RuvC-like Holliday junction resolvase [Gordonia phage Clown]QOC56074.1 RuvC-like resolvase [Gordonia phage Clown]
MTTVIGLDLSLTSTGYAAIAYNPTDGSHTVELRTFTSTPRGRTLADRHTRLRNNRTAIVNACRGADLVCVESPAFGARGANIHDLNGNWWLIVAGLHHIGVPVAEVNVATVKKFACDKGNGGKADVAAGIARMWPGAHPHGDNEFDALSLASIALILTVPRVTADQVGLPFRVLERHREAISKVQLPTSPRRTQMESYL